ncbi:MAG: spondin domain-containing protein [Akkermansiaceae bacterium]
MKKIIYTTLGVVSASATLQASTLIEVSFNITGPVGLAPVAAVFHDGSFSAFANGGTASTGLETLAEVGNPSGYLGEAPSTANVGTNGAPSGPGSTVTFLVTVADGNTNFNYAAMLLPSNDWFIGNSGSQDISSLLNAANGTNITFDVSTVWDAGTELEDFAFSAGNPIVGSGAGLNIPAGDAANGTDQNGVISVVTAADPFSAFANQPAGFDSSLLDFSGGNIGTFTLTVVPEPSSLLLSGFGLISLLSRRRR